jgi:hypothetical protein
MSDVTLHIPQELYEALREQACKHGQTPDSLAVAWLTEDVHKHTNDGDDPLVSLFGTLQSDGQNLAERHDEYVAQAILHELRNGDE